SPQLRQRESIHNRSHGVLANAEVQVPSSVAAGLEIARAFEGQQGLVGWTEITRASQEPGDVLRQNVQHLAGGVTARHAFGIGCENRQVAVPSRGQLALL